MPRITTLEVQAEISQALVVPGEDRLPTPSSAEHAIEQEINRLAAERELQVKAADRASWMATLARLALRV